MDETRFDNLTRSLAISRRGVLKQLAAGLLAGVSGLGGADLLGAQGCLGIRQRCASDSECCDGFCDPESGRCGCPAGTEACGGACVSLDQYQSDVENCGGCRTRCRRAPDCQTAACIDGVCGAAPDPSLVGQPCGRDGGVCRADGACACPVEQPTLCPRGCTDTTSDLDNCGACDVRCRATSNATAVCTGGVCGVICNEGYSLCGDRCCPDGQECCNGACCGPNDCCTEQGCIRCRCVIGIQAFADGTINPEHACQVCDPRQDPSGWTVRDDGTYCGDGRECCNGDCCSPTTCCDGLQCTAAACPDQCEIQGQPYEADDRNPVNNCQYCDPDRNRFAWTLVGDQEACGGVPGRVCCNGDCCSPTECCNPTGFCEECGPHCRIGGEDIDSGRENPANACEICNPESDFTDWSPGPDDAPCGVGQYCCDGQCCPPNQCCNDGACGECICRIGNQEYDRGDVNPLNACEACEPDQRRDGWSPTGRNTPCGLTDGRFCCAGDCCPQGECCNEIGECEPCGCVIGGEPVLEGAVNPSNTCNVCDPGVDRRRWTILRDDEACGGQDDDRVCCNGNCCPQGQCCEDGACVDCGCMIDGDPVAAGTVNPDNSCQICTPGTSRLTWTPVDNGNVCGTEEGQRCCGGDCCESDECCVLDACGTCLCNIEGTNVAAKTTNPDNVCEACDPENDPFGWSPGQDDTPCGDGQVCCSGSCCDPGECCLHGLCQFCGCKIGESDIAKFDINPDNECQWCDPDLDPFGWSPRSDEPCGGGDRVCCSGTCCGEDECCGLHGACEPCADQCTIGGETYDAEEPNPFDACQRCEPERSTTAWSQTRDNGTCGDDDSRFCCDGECCPPLFCCINGRCEIEGCNDPCMREPASCPCEIGGATYQHGSLNPGNECEQCDFHASSTAWTPVEDYDACGPNGERYCCQGTCCADGECCSTADGACSSGGASTCDGCDIDGRFHRAYRNNPDNDCEYCAPILSTTSWTKTNNNVSCGENRDGKCCNGICCAAGLCCGGSGSDGGCTACGCEIDGVTYLPGQMNPVNPCLYCNPEGSSNSWSMTDLEFCTADFGRECCNGVCCPYDTCCGFSGQCEVPQFNSVNCIYWQDIV